MALYNDIRDVGINRFIDHIESERRSHLLASELSELYQKAYTIATYSDPLQLSSHLAAAMGCGDNSVEPSEWLCIHYIHEIMAYVRDTVLPNLRAATTAAKAAASAGGGGPEALLREWVKRWKNFRQFIKGTYTIYMYLDRYHTQTLDMNIKEAAYNIYYRALWTGLDEFVAANSPVEVNAANAANAACEGRSSSATASAASACASASGDIPLRVFVPIARTPPTALNGYNAGRHPPMNPNNTQYAHSAAAQSAAANTRFTASRDLASGAPLRGGAAAKSAAASAEALALGHVTVGGFAHSAIDALCRLIESDRMATVAATVTTADAVSAAAAAGAGAGAGAAANTAAGAGASVADGAGVGESAVPLVGSTVDGALIRQAVNVFVELAQELRDVKNENTPLVLYNELQSRLNETTSQYYTALAADKLATHSLNGAGYFALVADALACEDERVRMFLHKTAQQSVFEATYGPLVSSQIQILLERSHLVPKLLHDDNPNDYNNMFRIFARNKDCLVAFAKRLHTHIRDSGAALIKRAAADETVAQAERERLIQLRKQAADRFNTEKAAAAANGLPAPAPPNFAAMGVIRSPEDLDQAAVRNLVTKLIAFYHHHMHSAQALGAEPSALQQLNEQVRLGFESFINVDERVARALAEYAGALLGKKGAAQTIGGVKPLETLANIVSLYGFVREKDVFESVYTRALHLRLLEGTSNSESEEKEFIQLLKSKSGYDWINSAEVMFSDMLASRSFGATFVNARATASRGPLRTANGDDFALEVQVRNQSLLASSFIMCSFKMCKYFVMACKATFVIFHTVYVYFFLFHFFTALHGGLMASGSGPRWPRREPAAC